MKVVVFSAHPDDETLGVGGILLRHIERGDEVYWALFTYRTPWMEEEMVSFRKGVVDKVKKMYPFSDVFIGDFPATTLSDIPEGKLISFTAEVISQVKPDIVYTVSPFDVHTDHEAVFTAVMVATKPPSRTEEVYVYEIPSSTNWSPPFRSSGYMPQVYVDITPYIDRKLEILSLFEDQIFPYPHARSLDAVRAYAMMRGSSVGVAYAETLMPVRVIVR